MSFTCRRSLSVLLFFTLVVVIIGCASTAPLPKTLNIIPPDSDVPPEIAAFSGKWKGMWFGAVDTALVVEKINTQEAEIIISFGVMPNFDKGVYYYSKVLLLPGPSFEWTNPEGGKLIYTMDKGLNKINASLIDAGTGYKFWGYLNKEK